MGPMNRRRLLTGGAGVVVAGLAGVGLVEERVLPGRARLNRLVGADGPVGRVPGTPTGRQVSGTFRSRFRRGAETRWRLSYPPGSRPGDRLPLLVALHGMGATADTAFDRLGLGHFQARLVRGGARPFVLASVSGDRDGYWHRRRDGHDSGAMVLRELVPLLAARGLDTGRLGLLGWSMGGYGALLLTATAPHRVAVTGAMSPALWTSAGVTAPGAFDDAADYARHNVFALRGRLDGRRVRIDCGEDDPFYSATREFVDGMDPAPAGGFEPGGHTPGYWTRMAPAQLAFAARHL